MADASLAGAAILCELCRDRRPILRIGRRLFGLFAAFLANDVQHWKGDLKAAVFREADGVRTILRMAEPLGSAGDPIKAAAVGYTQSVLTKEWPAMWSRGGAPEDLEAVRALTAAALAPELTAVPAAAHQAMIDGLVEVRQARLERLTLTAGATDALNWLAMAVLGVLTQVAVAVVQLDRLRPQALALFVFTTAFAATVAVIGLEASSGKAIDAEPLRSAVASATP